MAKPHEKTIAAAPAGGHCLNAALADLSARIFGFIRPTYVTHSSPRKHTRNGTALAPDTLPQLSFIERP